MPAAVIIGIIQNPLNTPKPMRNMHTIVAGQTKSVPIIAVVAKIKNVPKDNDPTNPQLVKHIPTNSTSI